MLVEIFTGIGILLGAIAVIIAWMQLRKKEQPHSIDASNHRATQTLDASTTIGAINVEMGRPLPRQSHNHPPLIPTQPPSQTSKPNDTIKKQKVSTSMEPRVEILMENELLEVDAGGHVAESFDLKRSDRVRGIVSEVDGYPFSLYIMNEAEYARFRAYRESDDLFAVEDESTLHVDLTIPDDDIWYFVFDAYGKRADRIVEVNLRRSPPSGGTGIGRI